MKRLLLVIAGIILFTFLCAFGQDVDDPGTPDSLIIGEVDAEYTPGSETYINVPIYFVTDDSIASVMLPLEITYSGEGITLSSATYLGTLASFEDSYISDDNLWFVAFNDLDGNAAEAPLYSNGARMEGIELEFIAAVGADQQIITIDIGEGPYDLPVNFGLTTTDADEDITPIVVPGYVMYGTVGIDDETALPTEYALRQNYPNPFNPETTIDYQLPQAGEVTIEIYNILGQNVRTLVSEEKQAGSYTARWNGALNNGSKAPSGIYFYKLTAGSFTQTNKMTMLK